MIIYKYPLETGLPKQTIFVPSMPKPISVGVQQDELMLWVVLDEEEYPGEFTIDIEIIYTGERASPAGNFVGTTAVMNGLCVFHVYAKVNYTRVDESQ